MGGIYLTASTLDNLCDDKKPIWKWTINRLKYSSCNIWIYEQYMNTIDDNCIYTIYTEEMFKEKML